MKHRKYIETLKHKKDIAKNVYGFSRNKDHRMVEYLLAVVALPSFQALVLAHDFICCATVLMDV